MSYIYFNISYCIFQYILSSAKESIPRGFRKEYIPCWSNDTENLKRAFEDTGDPQIAQQMINSLDSARTKRWRETSEGIDFIHSSRKGWNLLRRLGAAAPPPLKTLSIHPNTIADRLEKVSKIKQEDKEFSREIKKAVTTTSRSMPSVSGGMISPWMT